MEMKTLVFSVCAFVFGTAILKAQNLDRVALSSGGISSDTLNATIGEVFVFTLNGSGISLSAGSQSDQSNTGGLVSIKPQIEIAGTEILVYPNPVNDYLNLQINRLNNEPVSFQVYDASDKLLLQHTIVGADNLFHIQVTHLPQGNYFIRGITAGGETFGKITFIKL